MIQADLVVRNIGRLATLRGGVPRVGGAMRDLGFVENACLAVREGRIAHIGPDAAGDAAVTTLPDARIIDAGGALVLPGFVDAHTHLAYLGNRDDEISRRLAGETYAEIAAAGGGIVRSVEATRGGSRAEVAAAITARLDQMLLGGTTTAEVKSGYGLTVESEIRLLEAIRAAARAHTVSVVPTFLGAHEVPLEYRDNRSAYVDLVCDAMIPEVTRRGLAVFCDVFCERGVFTVDETRRILERAAGEGLKTRVHADELVWTGGAELAAALGARSADHLLFISPAGMAAMARSGTVATLLPAAAFFLRLGRYAPAREMIAASVPVALGSDSNPGGGLSPSMPFVMAVACFAMGLSIEEAVCAATLNAACSLDVQDDVGSLEVGKRADMLILRSNRLLDLLRVGTNPIAHVLKNGRVVVSEGRLV